MSAPHFNLRGVYAIFAAEMGRTRRTLLQSVATPVLTTALYFVVFGSAIGSRMQEIGGVAYGAFIVPGLIMLSLLTQSIANASIGIYFPKFTGTIYELLSAPISYLEIVIAFVGAAAKGNRRRSTSSASRTSARRSGATDGSRYFGRRSASACRRS